MADRSVAKAVTGTHPVWLVAVPAALALALSLGGLARALPSELWARALWAPDIADVRQVLVHHGWLPRLCVAWLCGAALALAGTVFQQVLRNPLAEPATLGVSAGAGLALTAATLWAPDLLESGREWVALGGAGLAALAVFGLAWRNALAPLSIILAGLVVNLLCGAAGAMLAVLHDQYLGALFLWGGGSLVQQDWSVAGTLAPRLALGALAVALMVRPLTIIGLDDGQSRALGLSVRALSALALGVAVALSAVVVAAVGVIGFIGLAAPALVGLCGARRLRDRLIWAPLAGAALLWLADQGVQRLGGAGGDALPTGAATALLGAPLLLWLMPRLSAGQGARPAVEPLHRPARHPWRWTMAGVLVLLVLLAATLVVGQGPQGWHGSLGEELVRLLPWRAPRMVAALAAGALLALAGALLQRLTGNPMASPEILGISSAAVLGVVVLFMIVPDPSRAGVLLAAALGSGLALATLLAVARRAAFAPGRVLLTGIAFGALAQALVTAVVAGGDPHRALLLGWMAGSTDLVALDEAVVALCVLALSFPLLVPVLRWLEILPLGAATARALGVDAGRSRAVLLTLAALFTGVATLIVGPLSFVGLMGPHLARMLGLRRGMPELAGSALAGALIMVCADWLGRNILFPYQAPAGLLAAMIGGPYLMWRLCRR